MDEAGKKQLYQNIEALLREQLEEMGVDVEAMDPEEFRRELRCITWPDGTMEYTYKDMPLLNVVPVEEDGGVSWKMFTK
jgi:hypothetical protein